MPKAASPTVSVLIPAFNAAGHLSRAVESALAQTHMPLEILIVDDGSRDRTAEIAAAFPPPVRLITKANGGPASARNRGAQEARGEWLALLDADDWWFPEKLRAQLEYGTAPDVGMVHCPADHRTEVIPAVLTFSDLWERNWVNACSVLMRRGAFEELGGFNEARELISVEDYNLWIRLAASSWRVVTCPEKLVHYTRGVGISSNSDRLLRASIYNIDDIGRRLLLPPAMIHRKRNQMLSDFAAKALFERDLPAARRLRWAVLRERPTPGNLLRLLIAWLPAPLLDARRSARRLFGQGVTPDNTTGSQ